jgi:ketol-acid reductoisomerase
MSHQVKKLAIISFGNQARAWAMNLRDSGWQITIFTRPESTSIAQVSQLNFQHQILGDQLAHFDAIALLIPDDQHKVFLEQHHTNLKNGTKIIYAHGHSLSSFRWDQKYSHLQHLLLAPKAIASELRFHYESKQGLAAVYSLEFIAQDFRADLLEFIQQLAMGLGINCGPYECTVKQETEADLLSEQSLLCGLIPYASMTLYNKMRKMGIPKELAYFEAWYECKLITQTLMQVGPERFFEMISPNALMGSELGRKELLGEHFQKALDQLAENISNGNFDHWVANAPQAEIKKRVLDFWSNQELSQVHKQLAGKLYGATSETATDNKKH